MLAGCLSVSIPPSSYFAKGHFTRVVKIGAWYHIDTGSIAPGDPRPWPSEWEVRDCGEDDLRVEIRATQDVMDGDGQTALCNAALKAIRYARAGVGHTQANVTFRAYLLPNGGQIRQQKSGWASKKDVVVEYAFPMNADESSTAYVVSAMAHEAFHLYGALASLPSRVSRNEPLAYMVGACAQLDTIGWLSGQDMPKVAFTKESPGISHEALASSQAGLTLFKNFSPYFDAKGEIRSPSPSADTALEYCQKTIASRDVP